MYINLVSGEFLVKNSREHIKDLLDCIAVNLIETYQHDTSNYDDEL